MKTKPELAHLAERIRKAGSSDSAYQHLLDTIADDIEKKFTGEKVCSFLVSEFVRKWKP